MLVDGARVVLCDVIMWRDAPWLVPRWSERRNPPATKPDRVIPMATLAHQRVSPEVTGNRATWVVNAPLPNALFDVSPPPQLAAQYGAIESPPIEFPHRPERN
jgi:hypothetical protein